MDRKIEQHERIERQHLAGKFSRSYFRTVVFRAREGTQVVEQTYRGFERRSSYSARYAPADEAVGILYDPADPRDFRLDPRWGIWGTTVCFVLGGLLLLAFGTAAQMGLPLSRYLSDAALFLTRLVHKSHRPRNRRSP